MELQVIILPDTTTGGGIILDIESANLHCPRDDVMMMAHTSPTPPPPPPLHVRYGIIVSISGSFY